MTYWLSRALLALASLTYLCPLAVHAQAVEDRVAFIIGNGGYPKSLALKNPLNDATAIEKQLSSLGFETKSYMDLKVAEVSGLRQQMESRLKRNSVLFFYYAGHGVQIDGRNYLLPVDATLNDGDKASQESLYLGDVLHAIERMRPKIAVVILDACRDNPFKDQKNSPAAKQGLARVDPPTSTVVFYATRPGGTAQDGDDENGVFTKALLQEIVKPEQPLEVVFRRVSTSVYKSTKTEQEPWIEGVIREEFVISNAFVKPLVQIATQIPPAPISVVVSTSQQDTTQTNSGKSDNGIKPISIENSQGTIFNQELVVAPMQVTDNKTNSQPISWENALRSLKVELNEEQKEFKTIYSCNNGNCIPYREWAHQLKSESGLQQLKTALETIKKTQKFRLCEFDLESNKCVRDDVKTSLLSPLTPISRHFIEGMKLSNVKTTKSGGLSFDGSMMQGERFLGITKGYATCAEQSGKLEFLNDIVELNIGRSYCLGVVPFPGTTKLNINVLIADPSNKQFIVKWDWGLVAFMAVGSGEGIARLTIE